MSQKLSTMKYIKNNKRRVAVPALSLCLCFVLTYITGFLLSTTEETFSSIYIDNAEKIQFVSLSDETLGVDTDLRFIMGESMDEVIKNRNEKVSELGRKLEEHEGVKSVYLAADLYAYVSPAIGTGSFIIPLVEKDEVEDVLNDFGTVVEEGRLPENPGEIVIDRSTIRNDGSELGGYYDYSDYKERYKIVGIIDSDLYFGCGIPAEGDSGIKSMIVFSDIKDMTAELKKENITVGSEDNVYDYVYGDKMIRTEIADAINNSTAYVYGGVLVILTILLTVVYTMYLRERHNEWCLYCSIGFSRTSIYLSIMRELLFTFVAALISGVVIAGALIYALDLVMIEPDGLKCSFFDIGSVIKILSAFVFLVGILQIPIRYALVKIRTVDAMEDDLY